MSNETYKHMDNSHKQVKEFTKGDYVMIRLKPKKNSTQNHEKVICLWCRSCLK